MHYGLEIGAPWASVVGAFEVHNIANDVYEHNFSWRPTQVPLLPFFHSSEASLLPSNASQRGSHATAV